MKRNQCNQKNSNHRQTQKEKHRIIPWNRETIMGCDEVQTTTKMMMMMMMKIKKGSWFKKKKLK